MLLVYSICFEMATASDSPHESWELETRAELLFPITCHTNSVTRLSIQSNNTASNLILTDLAADLIGSERDSSWIDPSVTLRTALRQEVSI